MQWEFAPERKAYSRSVPWDDGQTRRLANFERPQILIEDGQPTHLFAAMAESPTGESNKFTGLTRTWTGVLPLGAA